MPLPKEYLPESTEEERKISTEVKMLMDKLIEHGYKVSGIGHDKKDGFALTGVSCMVDDTSPFGEEVIIDGHGSKRWNIAVLIRDRGFAYFHTDSMDEAVEEFIKTMTELRDSFDKSRSDQEPELS